MTRLLFDLESDGLLDEVTKIHCICTLDADSGEERSYVGEFVADGVRALWLADEVIGHNIIGYDLPVLRKLGAECLPERIYDTMVVANLVLPPPVLKEIDLGRLKKAPDFPKQLIGRHSLEAWGHRLGEHKGSFKGPWDTCTPEMVSYCQQDVRVTWALYKRLQAKQVDPRALALEHAFAAALHAQEQAGVAFDRKAGDELLEVLQTRRAELDQEIRLVCEDFTNEYVTPVRKEKKSKVVAFNPQSTQHIARHLRERRGWLPTQWTPGGQPQVDERVLQVMEWPEARLFQERLLIKKRIGQLIDGKEGLFKHVKEDGRIYGRIHHNGTVTGRCAHASPNLGQIPRVGSKYGKEFRALFVAGLGKVLVGGDASGLELRCLAHYLWKYDDGAYAEVVTKGDVHTVNQKAAGLATRDQAKTFIYALLYGAGDEKIGSIAGGGEMLGRKLKRNFFKALPALKRLREDIKAKVKDRGYLTGLDGRIIKVRSEHGALNFLLQSAGAIVMKQAVVDLQPCLPQGAQQVLMVHDEIQVECRPEQVAQVGEAIVASIRGAGPKVGFRCPLDATYKSGANWASTH